jgi:hypothetical protein
MEYKKISDKEILSQAKHNIVTPFEEILRRITTAKVSKKTDNTRWT